MARRERRSPDLMRSAVRRASLAAILFLFWLALSGHYTPFLVGAGLVWSAAIAWYSDRFLAIVDREGHPIHMSGRALGYWPWLVVEIAKSAWDVSRRILSPRLAISPTMVRVRATQRTEVGRVAYANSITLTPGTITIEMHGADLLVHALCREGAAGLAAGDMDRRATRFEDEA